MRSRQKFILILSIFIAGLCSLIYELLISTASSYFLGDSVKQFSLTIGIYMASMGLGSYISRFIKGNLVNRFIQVEILLGLAGGFCVPFLYLCFAWLSYYTFFMMFTIAVIGTLTGLEIPLLTRIMKDYYNLKINLSNVLTLDYVGALVATLIFPFFLLPFLGTFQSSLIFGIINLGVGCMTLWAFKDELRVSNKRIFLFSILLAVFVMGLSVLFSQKLLKVWNKSLYEDRIVYMKQTPAQKIVITKYKDDVRLFINGNLQLSSQDEYRYHESIVHIPLLFKEKDPKDVLVHIDIVDIEGEMFKIAKENHYIKKMNNDALSSPKIDLITKDAFLYIKEKAKKYDLIISDLPDPNNPGLARLYSEQFYKYLQKRLDQNGIFITQATSPYFATKAFRCISKTIKKSGFDHVDEYHVRVPSFGDWGFVMASQHIPFKKSGEIDVPVKYLNKGVVRSAFYFGKDLYTKKPVKTSSIDKPLVLDYYLEGWRYYN
ncbi:MAG: polyamine aminopropyltransferase [Flavobacteriales bacterium]